VNEEIRAREVLLISQTGEQIGVVPLQDALRRAQAAELDLVEVAPEAQPPVCRIYDYKKVMYEQKRRIKASRKKARASELKELKMRVTIDPHDRDVKMRKAREFLEEGDKVKITLEFRGREQSRPQLGESLMAAVIKNIQDIGEPESQPSRQGRFMHLILARRKDWKPGKTSTSADAAEKEPTAQS
jgi:translation initiation factor IF-3